MKGFIGPASCRSWIGLVLSSATVMTAPMGSWAADSAEEGTPGSPLQEVTVTGSRIVRSAAQSDAPTLVISSDQLDVAGPANLETVLNEQPQFTSFFSSASNNPSNRGKAILDLRGLGGARTLVLLDGHRFDPDQDNGADITIIPSILLENVEVTTGGASAVYGSDAIAGVVNFKTRQNFEGVMFDGESGITEKADGLTNKASVLAGTRFADGRGHMELALEYFDRRDVLAGSRSFATAALSTTTSIRGTYNPTPGNLPSQSAIDSVFGSYGVAAGGVSPTTSLSFNPDQSLFSTNNGAVNYRAPATGIELVRGGSYYYNSAVGQALQLPMKRYSAFSRASYEVNDYIEVYGEAAFSNYEADAYLSPASTSAGTAFSVPVTNPFIPADLATLLASRSDPTASFILQKRFADLGGRELTNDTTYFQFAGGARGKLPFRDWTWDVYASRNRESTEADSLNTVSRSAVQTLLNASDGGASLCTGGYNPFGANSISASCAAYIDRPTHNLEQLDFRQVEANLAGSIVTLPAGALRFAAGAIHMNQTALLQPDPGFASGDVLGFGFDAATRETQASHEFYGELLIPLLADLPLVHKFEVDVGYRNATYNTLDKSVNSWKADGSWFVTPAFRFRGGFQHAIRVPTPSSLIAGQQENTVGIGTASASNVLGDPCDVNSSFRQGSNAAAVRALCIAQGVPASVIDSYTFGGAVTNIVGGNPSLKPEVGNTYSVGAVWSPESTDGLFSKLSVSVDYWNIDITGSFSSIDANTDLQGCFDLNNGNPTFDLANVFCRNLHRDPATGSLTVVDSVTQNLGFTKTSGVDLDLHWAVDLAALGLVRPGGTLSLDAAATHLNSYEEQDSPDEPVLSYAGSIGDLGSVYPRWKSVSTLTYTRGTVSAGLQWRYIDAMKDASQVASPDASAIGTPAVNYFDLLGRWKLSDNMEVRMTVNNLFDKQPPTYTSAQQFNTDPSTFDTLGRRYSVGFRAKF